MNQILSLVLICLALFVRPYDLARQGSEVKGYHAGRFDVDVSVQPDGALLVTETVVFEFIGGPFTRVFRQLPGEKLDRIQVQSAALDGDKLAAGTLPGHVEISDGNPVEVVWHLPPTSNETHTFTLRYRVEGVLQPGAGPGSADLLVWQVLPEERDYPIGTSRVTVTYPGDVALAGTPQIEYGAAALETAPGQITFQAQSVGMPDLFIVRVPFEPGGLTGVTPEWLARQQQTREITPLFAGLGIALAALGAAAVAVYVFRQRRPPYDRAPSVPTYSRPPADLPPAFVGALLSPGIQADWNSVLAALFDLARRGVVRFVELPGGKKWLRGPRFELQLDAQPPDLRPHESGLLAALFETKKGWHDTVNLSELGTRYSRRTDRFRQPLLQEMEDAGLIDPERVRARERLFKSGAAAVIVGGVAFIAAAMLGALMGLWPVMLLPAGLVVAGIVALIAGALLSTLSARGLEETERCKSFGQHLRDVTRDQAPASPGSFEPFLPYAAALGRAESWVKHFQKQGEVPIPAWFNTVSDGSTAWVALVAATSASSAAGSAAGAGGAAAGAAGGGASGAS